MFPIPMTQELRDEILDVANRAAEEGVSIEDFLEECREDFEHVCMDSD